VIYLEIGYKTVEEASDDFEQYFNGKFKMYNNEWKVDSLEFDV